MYHPIYPTLISYVPPDIPNFIAFLCIALCTQLQIEFFLSAPPHKMTIKTKSKAIGQKLPKQKHKHNKQNQMKHGIMESVLNPRHGALRGV